MNVVSSRLILKFLAKRGFKIVGRSGSHIRLKNKNLDPVRVVIVPDHKEIPVGTIYSILRQAGVSKQELFNEIKKK